MKKTRKNGLLLSMTLRALALLVCCIVMTVFGAPEVLAENATVTVSYSSDGADFGELPTQPQQYLTGDAVTVESNTGGLTKDGYVFGGWMYDNRIYHPGDTLIAEETDTSLRAVWIAVYGVTYDANSADSGSVPTDTQKYVEGALVTAAQNSGNLNESFCHYGFMCWNTMADGSGKDYFPGDRFRIGTENITLYAKYYTTIPIVNILPYYRVIYDANGSDNESGFVPVDNMIYGKNVFTNTACAKVKHNIGSLTKSGYIFDGWNTASDGSGTTYRPGEYAELTANTTLYANWVKTCSVAYHPNTNPSSEIEPSPIEPKFYPVGTKVKIADGEYRLKLYKDGQTFLGWNTEPFGGGESYYPDDVITIESDMTLYAMWGDITNEKGETLYTLYFRGCGNTEGRVPPTRQCVINQKIEIEVPGQGDLKRTGYAFGGWSCGDKNYHEGEIISYYPGSPICVEWSPLLTVSYVDNQMTPMVTVPKDENEYVAGVPVTIMSSDFDEMSDFEGWCTNSSGNGPRYLAGDTFTMTNSVTLYAIFSSHTLFPNLVDMASNVLYDDGSTTNTLLPPNHGTPPFDPNHYFPGDTVTVAGNSGGLYWNDHWLFSGWSTLPDGKGITYSPGDTFAFPGNYSDVTLYAVWKPNDNFVYSLSIRQDPGASFLGEENKQYCVIYKGTNSTGGTAPLITTHNLIWFEVSGNPGKLYRTDYTFAGWRCKNNGKLYHPGDNFIFLFDGPGILKGNGTVTFEAEWTPGKTLYTAACYVDNKLFWDHPGAAQTGDTFSIPDDVRPLTIKRYFVGWSCNDGNYYQPGDSIIMGFGGMRFDAVFDTVTHYYVNYDVNGGTGSPWDKYKKLRGGYLANDEVDIIDGEGMTPPEGCVFAGWNSQPDGSGDTYLPHYLYPIITDSDIRLYAIWKPKANSFSLSYNGNGSTEGSIPVDGRVYEFGTTKSVTLKDNVGNLKKGFQDFCGWWVNGRVYQPGDSVSISSMTVAYAVWSAPYVPEHLPVVSFDGNGSVSGFSPKIEDGDLDYDSYLRLPDNNGFYAMPGYAFYGWSDGTNIYRPGDYCEMASVVNDITFRVVWTPVYTVVYDGAGNTRGDAPADPKKYRFYDTAELSNNGSLQKDGYIFVGWWEGNRLYSPGETLDAVSKNRLLTAVWAPDNELVVSTPTVYRDGKPAEEIPAGRAEVRFKILNHTSEEAFPVVFVAAYDDKRFISIQQIDIGVASVEAGSEIDVVADFDMPENCYYVRFFGFKSLNSLTPCY